MSVWAGGGYHVLCTLNHMTVYYAYLLLVGLGLFCFLPCVDRSSFVSGFFFYLLFLP